MSDLPADIDEHALLVLRELLAEEIEVAYASGRAAALVDGVGGRLYEVVASMRDTHEQHIDNLADILSDAGHVADADHRGVPSIVGDTLTALADLFGVPAVLRALRRSEVGLLRAYEDALHVDGFSDVVHDVIEQGRAEQEWNVGYLERAIAAVGGQPAPHARGP